MIRHKWWEIFGETQILKGRKERRVEQGLNGSQKTRSFGYGSFRVKKTERIFKKIGIIKKKVTSQGEERPN